MSVYVDNARLPYGRMIMCHMVADNEKQLHEMANKIGLSINWFHNNHYNICLSKRKLALMNGAISISQREAVIIRRNLAIIRRNLNASS